MQVNKGIDGVCSICTIQRTKVPMAPGHGTTIGNQSGIKGICSFWASMIHILHITAAGNQACLLRRRRLPDLP